MTVGAPFRVALSADFLRADGTPAYPMFDLGPLEADPEVEHVILESRDRVLAAGDLEGFDALILLGPRFERASVPGDGRLRVIARFGVGYDSVDLDACTEAGIALAITPEGVRRPVAVAILTLLLACAGRLLPKDRLARMGPEGFALVHEHMGTGLVGRTLGAVGLGNIGAEAFRLAAPLGMEFLAYDPYADEGLARELGVRLVDAETLFRESDFVSVSCMLNEETRHVASRERIALMKPTAFLINTSRGGTVDQAALVEALREGRIAGAGLDVFDPEPPDPDDPLLKLDNVALAPHALCWTDQCFAGNGRGTVEAVLAVKGGRAPATVVNREVLEGAAWKERTGVRT